MRILHIGSNSIHVSSYVAALQKDGVKQFLISEEHCGFDHIEKESNISFRKMTPAFIIRNKNLLRSFMDEIKPDVIHIHQVNRLAFFAAKQAKRLNLPILTTAWGSDVLLMPKQNRLFRFLVKNVLKNSDIVTGDSQEMISAMQSLVKSENKYHKLQYGITPVQSVEKEKVIYSNRLLKPLYRIDEVLRYFADFSKQNNEWRLIVGGSGTELEHLTAMAEQLKIKDKVEFIGFVSTDTNHSIYAKASIYISIPKSDGTSVSLLEAMSAGCIPVVSDLEVSKEWIRASINGIIENGTENPLIMALDLDREKVVAINEEIIEREAIREASIKVFNAFYKQLSDGKKV